MSSAIKVTFGELASAQQNVARTSQQMTAQLEDLKRFLAPMVATWSGAAADDYNLKQRQWDTAAADLTAVLSQIGVAVGHANDGYQQVEAANARRWT
jgi:WXG100 family type VII secretion target